MLKMESIVNEIRNAFNDGIPNGNIFGWDADRFYQELSFLSTKGKLLNWTEFDYSRCNTFCFQISDKESRIQEQATLQISFISDVFDIHWDKFTKRSDIGRRISSPETPVSQEWEQNVKRWLSEKGFDEFPEEWYNLPINGVELELSEPREVTMGKCLFDE